jgi:hypothetical protein
MTRKRNEERRLFEQKMHIAEKSAGKKVRRFNVHALQVGTKVKVDETRGLGRVEWEGEVTRNDPKSPYIYVNGMGVRKYEVVGFAD